MIYDPCTVKRDFSFKPEAKSGSPLGFCLFVSVHLNSAGKKRDGRREFTHDPIHDPMTERGCSRQSASSCLFNPLQSRPGQGLVLIVCLVLMTATVG